MTQLKTAVTALLTQWGYCSLALSHRHILIMDCRLLCIAVIQKYIKDLKQYLYCGCRICRQYAYFINWFGRNRCIWLYLRKVFSVNCSNICCFKLSFTFHLKNYLLHDWPWISPWIKTISNDSDITIHVIASQLSGHCDVISNQLWRHQQNKSKQVRHGDDVYRLSIYRHLLILYVV